MLTCRLADTGRSTTRLGFGCSSIMGGMGRSESLRTLEWAFDAGIRHFDVAPMYGFGEAEACLGEFLSRHPGQVTVTTKYGIPPARRSGLLTVARGLARPVLKMLPGIKARAQQAAATVAVAPPRNLSAAGAEESLEASLRYLRVERIDVFLLHDAVPDEVRDGALLEVLHRAQQQGKIDTFGVGTDCDHAARIQSEQPEMARVVQTEWSVFDPVDSSPGFHIHHRSLGANRSRLEAYLTSSAAIATEWAGSVGADLAAPGVLSRLMMRAALRTNPEGIVLFSSKRRAHIEENARLAEPSAAEDAQADTLYRLVQGTLSMMPSAGER